MVSVNKERVGRQCVEFTCTKFSIQELPWKFLENGYHMSLLFFNQMYLQNDWVFVKGYVANWLYIRSSRILTGMLHIIGYDTFFCDLGCQFMINLPFLKIMYSSITVHNNFQIAQIMQWLHAIWESNISLVALFLGNHALHHELIQSHLKYN